MHKKTLSLVVLLSVSAASSISSSWGENLILNGFGENGDNLNFPNFSFDGTEFYQGQGAFVSSGGYQDVRTTELVPYNPNSTYKVEFHAKSSSYIAGNKNYPFLACYDVDQNEIKTSHTLFVEGSTTALASDLNDGDMYVYVDDLSGWVNPGSFWHRRGIRFWNYTNSLGYTYPAETYSRNFYKGEYGVGLWDEGVGLDYGNNRIILRTPWNGGNIPSGTELSQNHNGGTYLYYQYGEIGPDWAKRVGSFSPEDVLPGTAFLKLGWLLDYGSDGNIVKLSALQLTEVSSRLDVAGTIRAEEVIVEAQPWADYVFEDGYELKSLAEVESHIQEHGHLPGVPSAEEVNAAGISLGDSQRILLEKVEELMLHLIEKDKEINDLKEMNKGLSRRLNDVEETLRK